MINPTILSDSNADEAKSIFNKWLKDEPVTLLVVLGRHTAAIQALAKANEMINSGADEYASVRAVHAPKPEYIIPVLNQLKVNPDVDNIDWNNIGKYAILSVSNKYNKIGAIASNEDFTAHPGGFLNRLVLWAQECDTP